MNREIEAVEEAFGIVRRKAIKRRLARPAPRCKLCGAEKPDVSRDKCEKCEKKLAK